MKLVSVHRAVTMRMEVRTVTSWHGRVTSPWRGEPGARQLLTLMALGLLCCLLPLSGRAQILSTHLAYDEQVKRNKTFSALDENLFGDKINLQDGSVSFSQDDVVLATNSQLKVSMGRKTPSSSQGLDVAFAVFGRDWELNIPYMMGTFDNREGWKSESGTRCSTANFAPREWAGPWPNYYTQIVYAYMYWHGININIPGHGEELLLQKNAGQVMPTDGKTYYGTTRSSWRVSCLPSTTQAGGEGFAVTLPDGTVYYFDWRAERNAVDLSDGFEQEMDFQNSWHLLAPLTDVFLYPTKVVDRFGNFLTYTYDVAHPNRLTAITSNDGVRLDVQYNATGQISAVTSAGRTWLYSYAPDTSSSFSRLQSITLPDASQWSFALQKPTVGPQELVNFWSDACKANPKEMKSELPPDPATVEILTMTHPSGAKGEFWFRKLYSGTNNTPGGCTVFGSFPDIWYGTYGIPSAYVSNSIFQKTISGPAVPERTWNYMYYPSWTFASQCSGGCSTTSQTTVQTNDLVLRRYTFGNSYSSNLGQLLSETTELGGVVKQSKSYSFVSSAAGQPFADNTGDISRASGNADSYGNPFKFLNRPLRNVVTQLDGVTLTQAVNTFDIFVRPLSVAKSSSLGYSKTDTTEYQDDRVRWALGQVRRSATNGIESARTDYDAATLPWQTYAFGLPQQTLTYYSDGNLKTVTDGRNLTATVSAWKRGMPQAIAYPTAPATTQKAQVNDRGNFDWVENELGVRTSYGYDAMDRLSAITYPIGDTSAWNATTLPVVRVNLAEYGIPAGHWKRTEATGNGRTTTFYNALWQPVLSLTEDTGIAASKSFVVSRYDSAGRLAFTSYPVGSLTTVNDALQGSSMEYDALGRLTKVQQDSELAGALAVLTSTTEYLPGLKTRVTNPRGYSTTTSYQVFDTPDTSRPVLIQAPEGVTTTITRDVFGKPLTVTRSGPAG